MHISSSSIETTENIRCTAMKDCAGEHIIHVAFGTSGYAVMTVEEAWEFSRVLLIAAEQANLARGG